MIGIVTVVAMMIFVAFSMILWMIMIQLSQPIHHFNVQNGVSHGKQCIWLFIAECVTIGGLTADNQIFAEATSFSDLLISCSEPMSIFGLCYELITYIYIYGINKNIKISKISTEAA